MDIEFIKWMCEKADGFEWYDGDIIDPRNLFHRPSMFVKDLVLYSLLLQRAIEGVNRDYINWEIKIDNSEIHLLKDTCSERYFELITNPDTAKESALLYIYKQEKNS